MASSKTRQRKMERARFERQMARRAQKQRRRRQIQAGVGAFLAILLITAGTLWLTGFFEPEPQPAAQPDVCTFSPQDPGALPGLVDVGTPPGTPPLTGARTMTVATDRGDIEIDLALPAAPCSVASLEHLAGAGFYDDSVCHELTAEGALRCGDPSGTGTGGPMYVSFSENVPQLSPPPTAGPTPDPTPGSDGATPEPADQTAVYAAGTVALISENPGVYGSQFMIFYEDFETPNPQYPVVGTVTAGLEIVAEIGAAGTADGAESPAAPAEELRIETVTVVNPLDGEQE